MHTLEGFTDEAFRIQSWNDDRDRSNRHNQVSSEPGADQGPRAGSPRGVVVATGAGFNLASATEIAVTVMNKHQS